MRVQTVVPGSPATSPIDLVGTQALLPGDVITAVGEVDVASVGDLVAAVRRLRPQDPVDLTIVRADKVRHVQVPVARRQPGPRRRPGHRRLIDARQSLSPGRRPATMMGARA